MKKTKKILIISVLIIVCALLIFLCTGKKNTATPDSGIILTDSYSREAYLNIKGWDVTLIKTDTIYIPESFNGIYTEYANIQEKQKLPLKKYKGAQAERFLYSIENYNSSNTVYAELLIIKNELVGAALIGSSPDSFIRKLY